MRIIDPKGRHHSFEEVHLPNMNLEFLDPTCQNSLDGKRNDLCICCRSIASHQLYTCLMELALTTFLRLFNAKYVADIR